MTVGPSKIKCFIAGVVVSAAKIFEKAEVAWSFYKTLVYHVLWSTEHTGKLYRSEVLRVDLAQFRKHVLQLLVQERRYAQISERLGNKKAICVLSASFYACALVHDSLLVRKDEE